MTHDLASLRLALALAGLIPAACIDAPGTATDTTQGDASTGAGETSGTGSADADTSAAHDSSESDDATGALDPCAAPGWGAEPRFEPPAGRFTFRDTEGYRWLRGFIYDGVPVSLHQESEREGACRLLTPAPSGCEPACMLPALCIDGACVTEPSGLSAGAVTLAGVDDEPIPVAEDALHGYFWDREGADDVSQVTVSAAGADVDAFELQACATTAPLPLEDWSGLLAARAPGEPVTLTWSDPDDTARIYLRMTTGIGTHGGISPVEIECEGPDVGMLELPGAYLDALYADGWSCGECGGNDLVRYHVDETDAGGTTVQLRTEAAAGFWFIP